MNNGSLPGLTSFAHEEVVDLSIAENELGEYSLCNASVEWCGEITYERTVAEVVPCNTEITEDENGEVAIIKKTTEHFLFHGNMNNFIVHF